MSRIKHSRKLYSRAALSIAVAALSLSGTQAMAQESDELAALEEIIVTAQRREQSILEVPVALTSISADTLEKQQVDDIFDLMLANPSVSGITQGGLSSPLSNTPLRIRGVGTSGVNPGFESAVGMYVDEVYRSRPAVAMLTFYDMAGIDILRGPQGTLFGKNSTAGAIVQRTAAPEIGENSGYASLQYAEYNSLRAEGAANIAVGDTSAIRISALHNSTDGFFTQAVTNDDTIAESETQALRAQYAVNASDDLSIRLTADWMSFTDSSNYSRATRFDTFDAPAGPPGSPTFNQLNRQLSLATPIGGLGYYYFDPVEGGGFSDPRPFDYISAVSQKGVAEMDQYGLTAHVDYAISDTINFRSISSYRSVDNDSVNGDWDFGPYAIAGTLDQIHEFDTISQEFLFDFVFDNVAVVTGLHYFSEDIAFERYIDVGIAHGIIAGGIPGDPVRANPNVALQDIRYEQEEESLGIFGHVTYNFSDSMALIAGARWNQIDKDINYINQFGTAAEYHDAVRDNLSFYYGRAQATTAFPWDLSRSDDELTYDVALQWQPADNMQVYGKFSHGFKAGGFSMNANAGTGLPDPNGTLVIDGRTYTEFTPENAAFKPEFVDTYELGARWNTSRGLISAALFRSEYTDLQLTTFIDEAFVARSVGSIDAQGFEFDSSFNLTDSLALTAAFTILDTELGDDVIGVPIGREVAQAPGLSASVGIDFETAISDTMNFFAVANVNYQDDAYLNDGGDCRNADGDIASFSECDPTNRTNRISFQEQKAFYLFNATIGLNIAENYKVSLYCDNCLEEEYRTYAFEQPASGPAGVSIVSYAGAPRVVGARVKATF